MIIRVEKNRNFSVICNTVLRDSRLSFRARGIAAYLLSQPDGWRIVSVELAAQAREGRDAVRVAMKELEDLGYLRRDRNRDDKGRWTTSVVLSEYPTPEYPTPENPVPDDQAISTKYYKVNTNYSADALTHPEEQLQETEFVFTNQEDPNDALLAPSHPSKWVGKRECPTPLPPAPHRKEKAKSQADPGSAAAWEMYLAKIEEYERGAVLAFSRERSGINAMVKAGWTAEQIGRCFDIMKAQPFYEGKHLSAQEMGKDIGAKLNGKATASRNGERNFSLALAFGEEQA